MSKFVFLSASLLFIASTVVGQFNGKYTDTCANVTISPVPIPTDFPGYPDCVLGAPGCSRVFVDPAESELTGTDAGTPGTDAITGWITWDTQYLYYMVETLLTFNGAETSTQCLGCDAAYYISLCIDVGSVDSQSCPPPKLLCSPSLVSEWDYAFTFQAGSPDVAAQYFGYDSIDVHYQPNMFDNGTCALLQGNYGFKNPAGVEFFTPNGATYTNYDIVRWGDQEGDNPAYPFSPAELRSQSYIKIPLSLLGGATFGDVIKVWSYLDNAGQPADDLAPANPNNNPNQPGGAADAAEFHLKCGEDEPSCGNGVCEAGLENCLNCPEDCYGSFDPYDPIVQGPTAGKAKVAPFRGKSKHKGKGESPTGLTMASSTMKRKGFGKGKYGKGKGTGKSGGKNKAWGKGKIDQVCCGFFNGTGDGCLPRECRAKFIPTEEPSIQGKAKNAGKGKAGKAKGGKGKGYKPRQVAKGKGKWYAPIQGDYQCFNSVPYCGDGICSIRRGENCTSCPVDCGSIPHWGKSKTMQSGAGKASPKRRDVGKAKGGKAKAVDDTCCGGGVNPECSSCSASINCNAL